MREFHYPPLATKRLKLCNPTVHLTSSKPEIMIAVMWRWRHNKPKSSNEFQKLKSWMRKKQLLGNTGYLNLKNATSFMSSSLNNKSPNQNQWTITKPNIYLHQWWQQYICIHLKSKTIHVQLMLIFVQKTYSGNSLFPESNKEILPSQSIIKQQKQVLEKPGTVSKIKLYSKLFYFCKNKCKKRICWVSAIPK